MDILTGENFRQLSFIIWTSYKGQFVGFQGVDEGISILASCEHHFIIVHKNLVQHPGNYKSHGLFDALVSKSKPKLSESNESNQNKICHFHKL